MNKSDSERIVSVLETAGFEKTHDENGADLAVINTCSVRQTAIDRIFGNVKKYRKIKKVNPNFRTVITGCMLEKDKNKFKNLFDLVIDINEIDRIIEKLGINNGQNEMSNIESYFDIIPKHQSKVTAYVPIMTGCNNFCSYCVVPYTRGREKSRPVDEIINEISVLVDTGYKEIILLGQNVNSYESSIKYPESSIKQDSNTVNSNNRTIKQCNNEIINFPALLRLINDIPGKFWIRFLTSHPKDMTEELIKTVSQCEKRSEYAHLALQSGDDAILAKMNRKYTAKHFLGLVDLIREYMPNAAITTDIIVGFPGETDEQFQRTAEIMKKAKFDMAYINKYSPRAGTESSKMIDDISWDEKKRREKVLTDILKKTALENNQKYIGKEIDALVEKIDDKLIYGKTRTFKNIQIENSQIIRKLNIPLLRGGRGCVQSNSGLRQIFVPGQFIKAKIISVDSFGLKGELKNKKAL